MTFKAIRIGCTFLLPLASSVFGQAPNPQAGSEAARQVPERAEAPQEVRIFKPRHLSVSEASDMLRGLFRGRATISTDERGGGIVVRGSAGELDEIRAALELLDTPRENGPRETVVYRAIHVEATVLAQVLRDVLRVTALPVAGTDLIVVQSADRIADARSLITQLDVAPADDKPNASGRTLGVTIHFLSAKAGSAQASELPHPLAEVGAALFDQGVGDLRLLAHLMSKVEEGEQFSASGSFAAGAGTGFVKVNGEISTEGLEGAAKLSIKATLDLPANEPADGPGGPGGRPPRQSHEELRLETTATAPFGHYLAVGAIPTSLKESDTVIMVIQVTAE